MKKIVLVLLFFTTVFSQTSAIQLFDESRQALSDGNLELAGKKIRAAINADPKNEQLRDEFNRLNGLRNKANNANRSVEDRRYDDAIIAFTEVLESIPKYILALSGLAQAYERKEDYDNAIVYYRKVLSIDPNHSNAGKGMRNIPKKIHQSAGKEYKAGNLNAAISKYKKAISLNKNYWLAYYNLGAVQKKMGQISEAIGNYNASLSINPNYDRGWYSLGVAYKDNGELKKAEEAYKKAIQLNEKYEKAYKNLGDVYMDTTRYEEAIKSYKKAVNLKPNYGLAYKGLAILYSEEHLQDHQRSVEHGLKASELLKRDIDVLYVLAESYNKLGECEKATEQANKVIDLRNKFGGGWYQLGIAEYCSGTGNKSKALSYLERARDDREFRPRAEYEIDRVRHPEKYE